MNAKHIAIITRRADRRIMGRPGARVQLCGAEPTDRDITMQDFRRLDQQGINEWNICLDCVERAQEAR